MLVFFSEAQPILCKDSANREKRMLVFFSEAQPILCKDRHYLAERQTKADKLTYFFIITCFREDSLYAMTSTTMHT